MDNQEEVLKSLQEFESLRPKDIPRELEEYLNFVAKTGDPLFLWPKVKYLFRQKLQQVLCDYYESCPNNDILQCPNVDQFNFDAMRKKILERLESFGSAPFTIQRLSELLTCPRKEYNRTDKFMRAVEKNILVVTTREPGNMPREDVPCHVLNGVLDQSSRRERMDINDHPGASGARCELTSVSCSGSSGKPLNGMDEDDIDDEEEEEEEASEEDEDEESNSQEAMQHSHQESQESQNSCSPDRESSKSPVESSQINGLYKTQESNNSKIMETESPPPEPSNFNADKLAESSESSSSLPSENSEPYNAACQDFSSSSEENYQDSIPVCETAANEPCTTDIDGDPEAVENIRLPPEPYKGPQPGTMLAINHPPSSIEETTCENEPEQSETAHSDDVDSEPPPKRMRDDIPSISASQNSQTPLPTNGSVVVKVDQGKPPPESATKASKSWSYSFKSNVEDSKQKDATSNDQGDNENNIHLKQSNLDQPKKVTEHSWTEKSKSISPEPTSCEQNVENLDQDQDNLAT